MISVTLTGPLSVCVCASCNAFCRTIQQVHNANAFKSEKSKKKIIIFFLDRIELNPISCTKQSTYNVCCQLLFLCCQFCSPRAYRLSRSIQCDAQSKQACNQNEKQRVGFRRTTHTVCVYFSRSKNKMPSYGGKIRKIERNRSDVTHTHTQTP